MDLQSNIGDYLDYDDDINQHEVIVVHGKLSKFDKGGYTQFFLNPEHPGDYNINVLCAMSWVGNVGLNSPHIINVFLIEFPTFPLDFVQEIGRAERVISPNPTNYSYNLYICIDKFLYISYRCMNLDKTYNDEQFFRKRWTTCFI